MSVEASRVHTTINAPPATVWKALMTPASFKQFFYGSDVETDWRVGSPIRFRGEWNGKKYEDKGSVKTVDVNKRLAFTHWSPLSKMADVPENYHVVSFDLRPDGAGTYVELSQTNLSDTEPLTDENRAEYDKNWTMVLGGLKKAAEQG
jgi:uncharacterized protein YndB with AHSA1/START domain